MTNNLIRDYWVSLFIALVVLLLNLTPVIMAAKNKVNLMIAPLEYGLSTVGSRLRGEVDFIQHVRDLNKQTSLVELENAKLESQVARLKELIREVDLASIQQSSVISQKGLMVQVIGRGGEASISIIKVNRGTTSGVALGDVVVAGGDNLVGKVVDVYESTAFIRLVLDSDLKVAALDQDSPNRPKGVVRGQYSTLLIMDKIFQDEQVSIGDTVITSGEDGSFPKGLIIGQVTEVPEATAGVLKQAILESNLDLTKVEEVFILINQ